MNLLSGKNKNTGDGRSPTSSSSSITMLNFINLVVYVLNVVVTYGIGVAGFFGLPSNAELSAKYQTLVTPAGWAFSIWALIFLMQLVWVVLQLLPMYRQSPFVTRVGYVYVVVVITQVGWTLAFSNEQIMLSLGLMAGIWMSLLFLVVSIRQLESSILEYILFKFPFTLHLGWITAATAVNLNVVFVDQGVSANSQYNIAIVSAVALLVIGVMSICLRFDLVIPAVISWALIGVYFELQNPKLASDFDDGDITQVSYLALGISVSLLASLALQGLGKLVCSRRGGNSGNNDKKGGKNSNKEIEAHYVRQEDQDTSSWARP